MKIAQVEKKAEEENKRLVGQYDEVTLTLRSF